MSSRCGFLLGLGASLIVTPAIVRASSLMPVKPMEWIGEPAYCGDGFFVSDTAGSTPDHSL